MLCRFSYISHIFCLVKQANVFTTVILKMTEKMAAIMAWWYLRPENHIMFSKKNVESQWLRGAEA